MLKYPATFKRAKEGGFVVMFRDIPEAITQGDTRQEAQAMAADALLTALDFYFEERRSVPTPSKPREGEHLVPLPASAAAKVALLNAVVATNTRPADLARALGTRPQDMTRLLDLHHATKIDAIADALAAMGFELDFQVKRARPAAGCAQRPAAGLKRSGPRRWRAGA